MDALNALDTEGLARDAAAMVRVPSVTGDELAALERLLDRATALGLEADLHEHDLAALRAHPGHPGEEASRTPALSPRPGAEDSRRPGARPTGAVAGPARAPRDTGVTRASAAPSSSPLTAAPAPASAGREARPALMDSLASLMPAPAPAPPDGLTPAAPAPAPLRPRPAPGSEAPGDGDWTTLARKMQGLGISRFTIEGQPGGRVLFSCLIPLAGRQAVTQRFEAEGADAVQAARAALRRVALWRAAQPQQAR